MSRHIRLAREFLNIARNMDEYRREDSVLKMEGWLREVSNLEKPEIFQAEEERLEIEVEKVRQKVVHDATPTNLATVATELTSLVQSRIDNQKRQDVYDSRVHALKKSFPDTSNNKRTPDKEGLGLRTLLHAEEDGAGSEKA